MIFGKPFEFAVFYELLEKTNDNLWKYGAFGFFIDDEIYPSRGSNYTLHMAISYLKDSYDDVINCNLYFNELSENTFDFFVKIAHSHGMFIESDPSDLELPSNEPIGVLLSPVEILDVGFYLFYYSLDEHTEHLIYSPDYGKTTKNMLLKKGVVCNVIKQLPDEDNI